MNKLAEKLKKNSTIKDTAMLMKSKIYNDKDMIQTPIPMINVALSGSVDGGLTPGVTVLAGPSKHFKSAFSLIMAAAYQAKYPEGMILFYDTEFGTPQSYFTTFGVDMDRVIHTPITDVEQLKHDMMAQLKNIERGDKICIVIDSMGNMASKKEVDDALDGKSVADLSRSKSIKSLFRMITPHLTIKDIPLIAINHTYKTLELYSKDVVSGGCLIADTKITMNDGTMKNVQDVVVGDMVKTLLGNKEVPSVWNPSTLIEGTPECYEVEFEDGFKVICSDKHKFLIDGEWKESHNLFVGQNVTVV